MRNIRIVAPVVFVVLAADVQAQKLGTVHFQNSCSPAAQESFNRSVALLHSFEFRQAIDGFNATLKTDSTCAIADWGLALSAWSNPFANAIRPEKQIANGLAFVQSGRERGTKTQREKDYINAVALLYENAHPTDQLKRLEAYSDAMKGVAARYPNDTEASIFYALSLAISADPADKTYANQLKAGALLENLAKKYPDHPGLAHYIIHTYDVPPLASRALHAANAYSAIAPSLPHALHMPSHTFTRVGDWQKSIDANVKSAAAAARDKSGAEELHASDYRMYAYLQTAQDHAAHELLESIPKMQLDFDPTKPASAAPPSAGYFALAAMPARYALERGDWKAAAHLAVQKSPTPYADAITHFARALGAARIGDTATAAESIVELKRIRDDLINQNEKYWTEQAEIQIHGASAWLAFAQGKKEEALAMMREAAEREDATEKSAVTPGPIAPARELLGEMQLELNQPAEALRNFERTLKVEPRRFRTVADAAKAAMAAGDRVKAKRYYAQLIDVAKRGDKPGRPEVIAAQRIAAR
ncbi:MAG: tetratricopeptide repeat protein [Gemmatimonadaceae bacterium]